MMDVVDVELIIGKLSGNGMLFFLVLCCFVAAVLPFFCRY